MRPRSHQDMRRRGSGAGEAVMGGAWGCRDCPDPGVVTHIANLLGSAARPAQWSNGAPRRVRAPRRVFPTDGTFTRPDGIWFRWHCFRTEAGADVKEIISAAAPTWPLCCPEGAVVPGLESRAVSEGGLCAASATAESAQLGGVLSDRRADSLIRLLPALAANRDIRWWLVPLAVITMAGLGAGILAAGLPAGAAGATTVALLAVAAGLSAIALSGRIRDLRVVVPALIGVGLCGAGMELQSDGPGFVAG